MPKIPGTRKNALVILPEIEDNMSAETKNALAIRNTTSIEGECPNCGCHGDVVQTGEHVFEVTFMHEDWCPVMRDDGTFG